MRKSTLVAEWKAEGRAEGLAEARAQAIAEGIVMGKRAGLLEVLEYRSGAPLPPDLVATIAGQADPAVLSRWFKTSIKAETLDAILAEMAG